MEPKVIEKFTRKIAKDKSGCWLWIGERNPDRPYGRFYYDGKNHLAHRMSYELFVGPVPDGLSVDHLCRNVSCVNPDHLEAVTHRENILRGISPPAVHAVKTHCNHGHELTPENITWVGPQKNCRRCRECHRIKSRERQRILLGIKPENYRVDKDKAA